MESLSSSRPTLPLNVPTEVTHSRQIFSGHECAKSVDSTTHWSVQGQDQGNLRASRSLRVLY